MNAGKISRVNKASHYFKLCGKLAPGRSVNRISVWFTGQYLDYNAVNLWCRVHIKPCINVRGFCTLMPNVFFSRRGARISWSMLKNITRPDETNQPYLPIEPEITQPDYQQYLTPGPANWVRWFRCLRLINGESWTGDSLFGRAAKICEWNPWNRVLDHDADLAKNRRKLMAFVRSIFDQDILHPIWRGAVGVVHCIWGVSLPWSYERCI